MRKPGTSGLEKAGERDGFQVGDGTWECEGGCKWVEMAMEMAMEMEMEMEMEMAIGCDGSSTFFHIFSQTKQRW